MIDIRGVHHVKIPVSDLVVSRSWYETLLGLTMLIEFRDDDGVVRGVAYEDVNGFALALREEPQRAAAMRGFNPVAILVESPADLDIIAEELDRRGLDRTGPLEATIGWLLGTADPDGIEVRFYTRQKHP